MGRLHIYLPDDLHAQLEHLVTSYMMKRASLVRRGIELAVAEAQELVAGAALRPLTTDQLTELALAMPMRSPSAPPVDRPFSPDLQTELEMLADRTAVPTEPAKAIRRGPTWWFHLPDLCAALDANPEAVLDGIDPDDDILEYMDAQWIDERGVTVLFDLNANHESLPALKTWIDSKLQS